MLKQAYNIMKNDPINWRSRISLTKIEYDYISLFEPEQLKQDKNRRQQKDFRNKIIELYKSKCIVTGYDEEECEACHIIPVENGGDYSPYNGLLLNRNIHKLFDKFYWTIDSNTFEIKINPQIENKNLSIKNYKGIILNLPPETADYLKWHNYKEHLCIHSF